MLILILFCSLSFCEKNTFITLSKIMSINQKYELSKRHQKKWDKNSKNNYFEEKCGMFPNGGIRKRS